MSAMKFEPEHATRRPLRVALVEDGVDIRESLATALGMEGMVVVSQTEDSASALAWLQSDPDGCDVVVLDLFLAAGSGLDVLRQLQHMARPPRAIVLSNYATTDLRRQCEALGAAKTFDKASQISEMIAWLRELASLRAA